LPWRSAEVTAHQVQPSNSSRWSPTRRGRRQAGWRWGGARAWSEVTQACDPARARPPRCPAHRQHPPATAAPRMASSGIRRPRGPGRSAADRSACAASRNAAGWIPGCERLVARKSAGLPAEGAVRPPVQSDTSTTARTRKTLVPCCCRFTRIAARPYWIGRQTPTCRGQPNQATARSRRCAESPGAMQAHEVQEWVAGRGQCHAGGLPATPSAVGPARLNPPR
jgi:hypothetical protein